MAIRNIVTTEDSVLRKKCRPIEKFDDRLFMLLDDMKETMYQANGVGLAAPQVGVLRRVVVIDVGDGAIEMINPEIISTDGEQTGTEGCLSVPGEYGIVTRPEHVIAKYQSRDGAWHEIDAHELAARAICHECDHLDGKIYTDIAERMLTREELEQMQSDSDEEDD